jgi:hypothetical protein
MDMEWTACRLTKIHNGKEIGIILYSGSGGGQDLLAIFFEKFQLLKSIF